MSTKKITHDAERKSYIDYMINYSQNHYYETLCYMKNPDRISFVIHAIRENLPDRKVIIKTAFQVGLDPEFVYDRWTLLYYAVTHYDNIAVETIIDGGARINAWCNFFGEKTTYVHICCELANTSTLKLLIQKKAIIDRHNSSGRTPLIVACIHCDKIVTNNKTEMWDLESVQKYMSCIHVLIETGANVDLCTINQQNSIFGFMILKICNLMKLEPCEENRGHTKPSNDTILKIVDEYLQVLYMILEKKTSFTKNDFKALLMICHLKWNQVHSYYELCRTLIKKICTKFPHMINAIFYDGGQTLFMYSIQNNDSEMIEFCLSFPELNLKKTDTIGKTYLMASVNHVNLDLAKTLISRCPELGTIKTNLLGADVFRYVILPKIRFHKKHISYDLGKKPTLIIIQMVKFLLEQGFKPEPDFFRYVVEFDDIGLIKGLNELGLQLYSVDPHQDFLFHIIQLGNIDMFNYLLQLPVFAVWSWVKIPYRQLDFLAIEFLYSERSYMIKLENTIDESSTNIKDSLRESLPCIMIPFILWTAINYRRDTLINQILQLWNSNMDNQICDDLKLIKNHEKIRSTTFAENYWLLQYLIDNACINKTILTKIISVKKYNDIFVEHKLPIFFRKSGSEYIFLGELYGYENIIIRKYNEKIQNSEYQTQKKYFLTNLEIFINMMETLFRPTSNLDSNTNSTEFISVIYFDVMNKWHYLQDCIAPDLYLIDLYQTITLLICTSAQVFEMERIIDQINDWGTKGKFDQFRLSTLNQLRASSFSQIYPQLQKAIHIIKLLTKDTSFRSCYAQFPTHKILLTSDTEWESYLTQNKSKKVNHNEISEIECSINVQEPLTNTGDISAELILLSRLDSISSPLQKVHLNTHIYVSKSIEANRAKKLLFKLDWPERLPQYDLLYNLLINPLEAITKQGENRFYVSKKNIHPQSIINSKSKLTDGFKPVRRKKSRNKPVIQLIESDTVAILYHPKLSKGVASKPPTQWFRAYAPNIGKKEKSDPQHMFPFILDFVLEKWPCVEQHVVDETNPQGQDTLLYFTGELKIESEDCASENKFGLIPGCFEYFINSHGTLFHRLFRPVMKEQSTAGQACRPFGSTGAQ